MKRIFNLYRIIVVRGERGIWQRRYWENIIRDETDFQAHMDYVHINPVKHGLVESVNNWPYSTFHRLVEQGIYPFNWVGSEEAEVDYRDQDIRRNALRLLRPTCSR